MDYAELALRNHDLLAQAAEACSSARETRDERMATEVRHGFRRGRPTGNHIL